MGKMRYSRDMKRYLNVFYFLLLIVSLASCASYTRHYAKTARQWQQHSPNPGLNLKHTMYLIGDAGNSSAQGSTPVLAYLKSKLVEESENSSVLFLGDNIYEYGMPPKEDTVKRQVAEHRIKAQLEILHEFKGRPIFIPGNHDWRGWGQSGLKSQEDFIESYLNSQRGKTEKDDWENYFLPDDGCSGPIAVELNNDLVVLVVDSQWWLGDSETEPRINQGCEARNQASFRFIFENMVRKYRNQQVVIAMHHPPYTYGPHGWSLYF
jgi:Calcineurin-like phosphoesterase